MQSKHEYRSIFDAKMREILFNSLINDEIDDDNANDVVNQNKLSLLKSSCAVMNEFSCEVCRLKFTGLEEMRAHFQCESHSIALIRTQKEKTEDFACEVEKEGGENAEANAKLREEERLLDAMEEEVEEGGEECDAIVLQSNTKCANLKTFLPISIVREDFPSLFNDVTAAAESPPRRSFFAEIYRCVLFDHKQNKNNVGVREALRSVMSGCGGGGATQPSKWAILIYSGGKFAGGLFDADRVTQHKVMSAYIIRKKQGKAQHTHDSARQGGPGSCGAALRRENFRHLMQKIQKRIHVTWHRELRACNLIFLWAAKNQRGVFDFDAKMAAASLVGDVTQQQQHGPLGPAFDRQDPRLRHISIGVSGINLQSVFSVHKRLSSVLISCATPQQQQKQQERQQHHKSADDYAMRQVMQQIVVDDEEGDDVIENAKISQSKQEPHKDAKEEIDHHSLSDSSSTSSHSANHNQPKLQSQSPSTIASPPEKLSANEMRAHERLMQCIIHEDVECVREALASLHSLHSVGGDDATARATAVVNAVCAGNGFSALHLAVQLGRAELIPLLLDARCDPAILNMKGQTAYQLAALLISSGKIVASSSSSQSSPSSVNCCEAFRIYRFDKEKQNEEEEKRAPQIDYATAGIPDALDPLQLAARKQKEAERKRRKKKEKKARDQKAAAQQHEERMRVQRAEAERRRFLELSDREKRSLAAERRCLQNGQQGFILPLKRCFQCGRDITGQVPFSYNENIFCAMNCLREHRNGAQSEQKQSA